MAREEGRGIGQKRPARDGSGAQALSCQTQDMGGMTVAGTRISGAVAQGAALWKLNLKVIPPNRRNNRLSSCVCVQAVVQ